MVSVQLIHHRVRCWFGWILFLVFSFLLTANERVTHNNTHPTYSSDEGEDTDASDLESPE